MVNQRKNSAVYQISALKKEMKALRVLHNRSYKDITDRLAALEKSYEIDRFMNNF